MLMQLCMTLIIWWVWSNYNYNFPEILFSNVKKLTAGIHKSKAVVRQLQKRFLTACIFVDFNSKIFKK